MYVEYLFTVLTCMQCLPDALVPNKSIIITAN